MTTYTVWGWLLIPASYLIAFLLSTAIIPCLQRLQVMDVPNERSSHQQPVPRAGGIVLVFVFVINTLFLYTFSTPPLADTLLGLLFAGVAVAAVGLYDDIKSMSPSVRFALYSAIVIAGIYALGAPNIPFGNYLIEVQWGVYLLEFVVLLWVLNLFNFMDGIDGIASIEAISITLLGGLIIALHNPDSPMLIPLFSIAAACGGFLIWNYPPAKVFMGDVASGFLGLIPALIGVVSSIEGSTSIWVWFILYGVFFVDATTTLLRHIWRKQSIHIAHCNHAYQRAVIALQNKQTILQQEDSNKNPVDANAMRATAHRKVSLAVLAINFLWLAPWAVLASFYPNAAVVLTATALLPLVALALKLGAGSAEQVEATPLS